MELQPTCFAKRWVFEEELAVPCIYRSQSPFRTYMCKSWHAKIAVSTMVCSKIEINFKLKHTYKEFPSQKKKRKIPSALVSTSGEVERRVRRRSKPSETRGQKTCKAYSFFPKHIVDILVVILRKPRAIFRFVVMMERAILIARFLHVKKCFWKFTLYD